MDLFNLIVIEVFHRCTKDFPSDTTFTAEDITQEITKYYDEAPLQASDLEDKIFDTVHWLEAEGFLRDRGCNADWFTVIPTQRGLQIFNTRSVVSGESIFDTFKKGLSKVTLSAASTIIAEIFKP